MIKKLLPIAALLTSLSVFSQQHFPDQIPAGDYSGICAIGDGLFAVVDDKHAEDGFYVFRLDIDTQRKHIRKAENLGYRSSGLPNRDMEGICYRPSTQTVFISGEADNEVYEYSLDGKRTGNKLNIPAHFKRARSNKGIEALTYDTLSHQFFLTSECPLPGDTLLRIQAFGDDLQPTHQYLYKPDELTSPKYTRGVSALCAMYGGSLFVLERQVHVPRLKLEAHSIITIYEVNPAENENLLTKRLINKFATRLTVFGSKFANYEGMCAVDPYRLLLIADSQRQYKGALHDWFLLLDL